MGKREINGADGHKFSFFSRCGIATFPLSGQGWDAQRSLSRLLWPLPPSQGNRRERKPLLSCGPTLTSVPDAATAFYS